MTTKTAIAAPYIVTLDPEVGPQEILTFFADGNARRTVSLQFSGGAGENGFSDSQGVWRQVGPQRIRATFFNINFSVDDGSFEGLARVNYDVMFDSNFRMIEGSFAGQVFPPGVNPADPGDAEPTAEFSGNFLGERANVQQQPIINPATDLNPSTSLLETAPTDIIYDLSWEGENGYTMKGLFSFNSELEGSLINADDLTDMQLAFFEPDGTLLQVFDYDFPNPDTSGEFNFNFDSAIDQVLRFGESDTPTGFDLGIDFQGGESGIGFFTGDDDQPAFPAGIITLGDADPPNPTELLDQGGEVVAFLAEPFEVSEI